MMLQRAESKGSGRVVFLLNSEQVDYYWSDIQQVLASCPGYYELYTPEWTYQRAKTGDLQVWALSDGEIKGIVVSQISVFPVQKVFEVLGAAGNGLLDFFDEMEELFEFIAADCGCGMISARVRPGIERLLRKRGTVKMATWLYRPVGKSRRH
jgi:hypothetical protein